MKMLNRVIIAVAVTAAPITSAQAQTFFGTNPNPNDTATGAPVTARAGFLGNLGGVSTEDFDGFAAGTSPSTLTFNGSAGTITATLAGGGEICRSNGCNGAGRFATSSPGYYDTSSSFSATFSSPIAAFGFYGTDIGDLDGVLQVTLTRAGGTDTILTVPQPGGSPDGSLLFFGVIDQANPFTGVSFSNSLAGTDFFGFDDLTIGDVGQVTGGVPEPATWAMMIFGMGAVGGAMRRRRNVAVRFAA